MITDTSEKRLETHIVSRLSYDPMDAHEPCTECTFDISGSAITGEGYNMNTGAGSGNRASSASPGLHKCPEQRAIVEIQPKVVKTQPC